MIQTGYSSDGLPCLKFPFFKGVGLHLAIFFNHTNNHNQYNQQEASVTVNTTTTSTTNNN